MTDDFTPHPGSRMDATARAADQETPLEEVRTVTGYDLPAVRTAEELPALGRGYVIVLGPANPVLRLLPQDPQRRSAVVLAVDNDVYIGDSKENVTAAQAAGTAGTTAMYLPAGIALPVSNKAAWYAGATTTGTSSRVSVLISLDNEA